jgi:hypothetical protein
MVGADQPDGSQRPDPGDLVQAKPVNYSSMMSMKATLQKAQGAPPHPSGQGLDKPAALVFLGAVRCFYPDAVSSFYLRR